MLVGNLLVHEKSLVDLFVLANIERIVGWIDDLNAKRHGSVPVGESVFLERRISPRDCSGTYTISVMSFLVGKTCRIMDFRF